MAHVVERLDQPSTYKDRQARNAQAEEKERLAASSTLYVGNLSFFTTESQIYELFSQCASPEIGGGIKRIIMGLDRNQRTPCGFAFVEYYLRSEALASMRYISGTKLDERVIRCDLDPGYLPGRELGRGKSGGQVRDEYREEYDPGRGGWGHQFEEKRREAEARREQAANENYQMRHGGDVATGEGHEPAARGRGRSDSLSSDDGDDAPAVRRGEREEDAEED